MRWPTDLDERFRAAFDGKRVCVTGGAGFIGGHLCEALVSFGAHVCIVDDLSALDASTRDDDAPDVISTLLESAPEQVRFVHASVLDPHALDDAMERARYVFHLAAVSSVTESVRDPARTFEVNARGTVEVCSSAQVAGAKRIVYAASSSAYGDAGDGPIGESSPPSPLSPYAASKLAGEHIITAWDRTFGLSGVSLRLFNVYGPRQRVGAGDEGAVVSSFIHRLRSGEPPEIYGDGRQTRDFVHVDDVVEAMLLSASMKAEPAGRVFNVGTGRATTILDLAALAAEALERKDLRPKLLPERPGDIRHSRADTTLAREALGFEGRTSLVDGLAHTLGGPRGNVPRTGARIESPVRADA